MKQYEAVIETLRRLGGYATLGKLNQEVFKIKECEWNTKTPFASIRRIVQDQKEIFRIRPGVWALEEFRPQLKAKGIIEQTPQNEDSFEVKEFNHAYYQGLLLHIGNMMQLETFVPAQDKNKKFINETLGDISTLHSVPKFSYEEFVNRSRTIDVMWFEKNALGNNVLMPSRLFEVEHSTDIQNSLLKFADLDCFNVKMYIVADGKREGDFHYKINHNYFESIKKRVEFVSYDRLDKLYEGMLTQKKSSLKL